MATIRHYPWARRRGVKIGGSPPPVAASCRKRSPAHAGLCSVRQYQQSFQGCWSTCSGPSPINTTSEWSKWRRAPCNEWRRALESGRSRSESQHEHDLSLNKRHNLQGPQYPHFKNSKTTFTGRGEDQQRCCM